MPGVVPLQVWQVPHTALPQQTLLTQLPLIHSPPPEQASPLAFSAQLRLGGDPWQVNGARQCESIEQLVRQVGLAHMYGEQLDEVGARQPPVPLQ